MERGGNSARDNAFALLGQGRVSEALVLLDQVVAHQPGDAAAHACRGFALNHLGRSEAALASLDRALALDPREPSTHFNRAMVLLGLGRLEEGVLGLRATLALRPGLAEAHYNLGTALKLLGRNDEALQHLEHAVAADPGKADGFCQRGAILADLGRPAEALADFDRALRLNSRSFEAHYNRGNALHALRRFEDAVASFDRAIALQPNYADAHFNRGNALIELRAFDGAVASFDQAIIIAPDHAPAHYNRAKALVDTGRTIEALAGFRTAQQLAPDLPYLRGQSLRTQLMLADWRGFDEALTALREAVEAGREAVLPLDLMRMIDDPGLHCRCAEIHARQWSAAASVPAAPAQRPDRLRIGYFSADFHNHATMHLIAELVERHARSTFEVYCFSFGPPAQDHWRQRAEAAADRFIDVCERTDDAVVELARELGIHIAVDLKGYTTDARPGIFAARAAPLQLNYLGFPGTMAAPFIDYIVADRLVIPSTERSAYRERVIHLPASYQANCSSRAIAEGQVRRSDHGLPDDGFVFCCFNDVTKILPAVFAVWMDILRAADSAVLWLLVDNLEAQRNLRAAAVSHGVQPDRLVFARQRPVEEHLARLPLANLFLDTLPYTAHTTASDALRMGVPLLTCAGRSFASRVAASLLTAVGLPDLITADIDAYRTLALDLAIRAEHLRELRQRLSDNLATSPLFDAGRFTRDLERGYRAIFDRQFAGLQPADIDL
jgi:predicted O-linked N-acetylglucosamine transferase (SPINDLY family)